MTCLVPGIHMQHEMRLAARRRTAAAFIVASVAFVLSLAILLLSDAQPAYAFHEPYTSGTGCSACHNADAYSTDCTTCHDLPAEATWYENDNFAGPHGDYQTTSSKCDACHSVHNAPADSIMLLPGATVVSTCETCHDGTGGYGVYGAILAVTGVAPASGHGIETTNVVPGGDAATGGSATMTFRGPDGKLVCTDCHSPHGADVVNAFVGDRRRLRANFPSVETNRLLRRQVGSATAGVDEYGSDWCLGCHAGRASTATVHNHPVDSVDSSYTVGTPYTYGNVAILADNGPTTLTVLQGMGGVPKIGGPVFAHAEDPPYTSENRGYLMPYPRTAQQTGHAPICQQCHEDSRNVGTLSATGSATALSAVITVDTADGVTASDNPRFQNFPHETQNDTMLVEDKDNLCLNCHPLAQLP